MPRIAVIVPARDEEANIGRCVETVLAQDYPAGCLDVLVVDDQSSDATAAVVRRLAARHRNVALIQSPPLPPRWVGKSHACWIGARSVAPETWIWLKRKREAPPGAPASVPAAADLHIVGMVHFRAPFWYGLGLPRG